MSILSSAIDANRKKNEEAKNSPLEQRSVLGQAIERSRAGEKVEATAGAQPLQPFHLRALPGNNGGVRQDSAARPAASSGVELPGRGGFGDRRGGGFGGTMKPQEPRRTTKGGFYSQPELGADTERLRTATERAEQNLKTKQQELERAAGRVSELEGGVKAFEERLKTMQGGMYQNAYANYQELYGEYEKALEGFNGLYTEYQPLLTAYNEAAGAYNGYIDQQQKEYGAWRGTIRGADAVQADISTTDAQIAELEKQKKSLANTKAGVRQLNRRARGLGGSDTDARLANIDAQLQELDAQLVQAQAMKELLQEELDWSKYYRYDDLKGAEDYGALSKYATTANGQEKFNAWSGTYTNTGFDDITYDYINRNKDARSRQGLNDIQSNASFLGLDDSFLQEMTDDEVGIFNYLYAKEGKDAAYAYIEYLTGDLNYRQRQKAEADWAKYAKESPVASSVFSVLEYPLKGLSYLGQFADYTADGKIDQNAGYNKFSYANSAIRNEVSNIVEDKWGGVGTFAYQTGMSMGDFLFNTVVSGGNEGIALAIMGTGAAADGTIQAKDRGLSDNQAFAIGTIAGAAEIVTEKLSLDALLKGKWEDGALKYILKNTLTEGSEEVGSDLINLTADILIAKDKSEWKQSIEAYKAQGMTEQKAFCQAVIDQALSMGLSFLGGAVSGGIMAGAGAGIGAVTNSINERTQQSQQRTEEMQNHQKPEEAPEGIVLPTAEEVYGEKTQQMQQEPVRETVAQEPVQEFVQRPGVLPTAEEADRNLRAQKAETELERTGILSGVEQEGIEQAQRISRAIGKDIVFYRQGATGRGIRNGYYSAQDGKIHVNAESKNPLAQIISHELTHSVELADAYSDLSGIVLRRIQDTGADLQQLRQVKQELYARNGVQLGREVEIDQEIVAEYVEKYLLTDEGSIMELTRENRTLGEKIMRWLNSVLAKLGNSNAQERAFLTNARDIYARALSQTQEAQTSFRPQAEERTTQQTVQETAEQQREREARETLEWLRGQYAAGEITEEEFDAALDAILEEEGLAGEEMLEKNSFGGTNANRADLGELRRAQEMERQGVAPDIILKETGWFTGADGKWRFEIDDSKMQYHRMGDAEFGKNHPDYARYQELMGKVFDGTFNEKDEAELQRLDEIWGREPGRLSERVERGNATLENIIDHEELFDNYPQLRKTRVEFADMGENTNGQYSPDEDTITLDNSLRRAPQSTLVHEIQHAIQKAEGFTGGSNPAGWAQVKQEITETIKAGQENLELFLKDIGYNEYVHESLMQVKAKEKTLQQHWADIAAFKANSKYARQIANCEAELATFREQYDQVAHLGDDSIAKPEEMYWNTAGEKEARDVSARREMTQEQRRNTMPDTGDERTVYAEQLEELGHEYGVAGYSMDTQEGARYNEETKDAEGGVNYGRGKVADDSVRGRSESQNPGKRAAESAGDGGVSAERSEKAGFRVHDGRGGQNLLAEDSEGRGLTSEQTKQLQGTAIVDETGRPLAVYHFTQDMEFQTFAQGDIGFHFGTQEQAQQRGKDLQAERGRMFRAYLNIQNPYRVRLDLNTWRPSHTGLYLWSEGVLSDAEWAEIRGLDGSAYDSEGAQRMREMLEEKGIDGIAYPNMVEGEGDSYIAFRDDQIVKTDILPVKEKFSISEPVEQTETLLALHNMSEEKLRRTLNMGAWPAPSIAIVEAEQGHADYGEFSAVFPRSVIDPETDKRNRVYGSDAWTPTHANAPVEYEVDYDTKRRIENMVEELSSEFAGGAFRRSGALSSLGIDDVTSTDLDEIARRLSKRPEVQAAYLQQRGDTLEPSYKPKKFDNLGNELLQEYIDRTGAQEVAEIAADLEKRSEISDEAYEAVRDIIVEDWIARNERLLNRKPELKEKRIENQRAKIDRYRAEQFVRHAWEYHQDGGATKGEIDGDATGAAMYDMIAPDGTFDEAEAMVQDWVRGELDGLLSEPGIYNGKERFDRLGNRKNFKQLHYPYTAENIVKAMYENGTARGEGLYGVNAQGLMSVATPEYKSVEEIHRDEGRLRTAAEEEYKAVLEKIDSGIDGFIASVRENNESHSDNPYEENDIIGSVLLQAAGSKTENAVKRVFGREGYTLTDEQAKAAMDVFRQAAEVPTGYFEAKPERVVDFDEALAVVAPDSTPAELLAAMRNAGMNVVEYEAGNEKQRLDIINGLEGAKFSIDEEGPLEAKLPGGEQDITESMPVKAQTYLKRAERSLLKKVGDALSVPSAARREFLQDIVRDISTEYMETGRVSQETMDALFERAWDEGIEVDSAFYDEYKPVKDYLRTQAITIAEQDKADIADYNDFRKSAFGTLRIVNDGGLPVDVAYQELQSMALELFPDSLTHPGDQLMRMYEIARSIEKVERTLDEVHSDDPGFKAWAKYDFDTVVNDALGELRTVKRFVDERTQQSAAEEPMTQEAVMEMYAKLKDARRTYEKAAAKNLLTAHDEVQVGRLLRGELELEHLDPAKDNIKGITAVYEAKREYEQLTRGIKKWNQTRRAAMMDEADGYLKTANSWKDKKAGILYSRETMERNIRDIVKDEKLADEIIGKYFKPVHDAAAEATRMKNDFRDRVRELNLSRKVEKGNEVSEAHAVQLLGEAEDNIRMLEQSRGRMQTRDGKTLAEWRTVVEDLWNTSPNLDEAKIRAAVQEFRSIYDELFLQMNDARVRNGYEPVNYRKGYFPHFQPGDSDGILAQFGKAMGIDTEVAALPTTINGLTHTFKPGIQWFGNAQERLGFNTAYDAVEGFDKYIEGVADVIHQTDNIQQLRAFATQARYRTGDEGIQKQVDAVRADTTLSEADKQNRIEKIYETGRFALSNFVVELEEYTNLLANKKSRADRNMEQALGRRMYNLMKALESRVAANMVAVNPASWLTNFIPLTQGGATLDRGMLLHGMWDTMKAYKESDGIVDKSAFLTNRRGSDPIVKTWAQAASAKLSSPMEYIDQFTADSLVRARYRQNLNKGLSEAAAMSEADAWAAGVMADRSKGSTPTMFNRNNPLTKVFTQFQLEVNNQLSYLFKDMPRDTRKKGVRALAAALIKFMLGAFLYNEVYEYVIGRRPALDPLGILNDTVGDMTGYELPNLVELGTGAVTGEMPSFETEKKNAYETAAGVAGNVAEELPFIGGVLGGGRVPISSALPDWERLGKAALSDGWDAKKRLSTAAKELGNPLTYLALPFGGGQLKKIYQGLKATAQGGSYTVNSKGEDELQYPVYNDTLGQTIGNTTRSILFGKTSLPTAREWVENGFKSMGAKETACYQGMLEAGVSGEDAYELLKTLRGAEKTETESEARQERRLLRKSDIDGAGKSIVYYGLMASESEQKLMDKMADMGADMGEVSSVLMEIKDAGDLKGAAASNAKREAIAGSALTDEEKIALYRDRVSDSRDDDIAAFQKAGMDFDQFLKAHSEYTTINEEYDGAGQKATEFSRWVNSQTLTAEQAETMKECFKYFSQMPAQAGRYDSFTSAGLEDDAAYELAKTLDGLEPVEGKDSVSSLQKYRAVVDSGLSEDDQMAALGELMTDAEYSKMQTGHRFGVSPGAYVAYREKLPLYDADGNGTFKQEEVTAALQSMMAPNEVKAALWQMANKSWKPKNNPFNTRVGGQVYDALNADEEAGGLTNWKTGQTMLPTASGGLKNWN